MLLGSSLLSYIGRPSAAARPVKRHALPGLGQRQGAARLDVLGSFSRASILDLHALSRGAQYSAAHETSSAARRQMDGFYGIVFLLHD